MRHLTQRQIGHLKKALNERIRALRGEIHELLSHSDEQHHKDLAGLVADAGDEAVANMLTDLDTAIVDRHVQELRDVEAAQRRLDDGSYGVCIDCGGEVAYDRLKVYPAARRCLVCQRQREKVYAHEGTPRL